jgi:heme exporter protein A
MRVLRPVWVARVTALRLVATELACIRGGQTVFNGLDFAVEGGQSLVVTGPNGAGKTTLLRLMAGLVHASAGRLTLTGADDDSPLAEQAHYVGHQDALKPALTVAENLAFWAQFLGGASGSADRLAQFGLQGLGRIPAAYLSAGQRRRLSLCRLVAVIRPIWLLDEPTTALDGQAVEMLGAVMQAHLAGGGIVVAATHAALPLKPTVELKLDVSS